QDPGTQRAEPASTAPRAVPGYSAELRQRADGFAAAPTAESDTLSRHGCRCSDDVEIYWTERWPSGRRRGTGIPVTSSRVFVGSNPTLSAIRSMVIRAGTFATI